MSEKVYYVWCPRCAELHVAKYVKDDSTWEIEHYDTECGIMIFEEGVDITQVNVK